MEPPLSEILRKEQESLWAPWSRLPLFWAESMDYVTSAGTFQPKTADDSDTPLRSHGTWSTSGVKTL